MNKTTKTIIALLIIGIALMGVMIFLCRNEYYYDSSLGQVIVVNKFSNTAHALYIDF